MKSSYDVSVPSPVDTVWAALADLDRVLAALGSAAAAGASVTREGDAVTGSLRCRFGATQVTYRVTAGVAGLDAATHSGVITVSGKEARGSGTLAATVTLAAAAAGTATTVTVDADIDVTGRGETAAADQWSQVLETLLTAALPTPAAADAAADEPAVEAGDEPAVEADAGPPPVPRPRAAPVLDRAEPPATRPVPDPGAGPGPGPGPGPTASPAAAPAPAAAVPRPLRMAAIVAIVFAIVIVAVARRRRR